MAALERRTAAVELSEPCASCGRPLSEQPPASAGPTGAAGAGLAYRSTLSSTLLPAWRAMFCMCILFFCRASETCLMAFGLSMPNDNDCASS